MANKNWTNFFMSIICDGDLIHILHYLRNHDKRSIYANLFFLGMTTNYFLYFNTTVDHYFDLYPSTWFVDACLCQL